MKQGEAAAVEFLRAVHDNPINVTRSRLLLIGDGGAGKTTLKAALQLSRDTQVIRRAVHVQCEGGMRAWDTLQLRTWVSELTGRPVDSCTCVPEGLGGSGFLDCNLERLVDICPAGRDDVLQRMQRVHRFLNTRLDHGTDIASFDTPRLARWLAETVQLTPDTVAKIVEQKYTGKTLLRLQARGEQDKMKADCQLTRDELDDVFDGMPSDCTQSAYQFLLDIPHVWTEGVELEYWAEADYSIWDFAGQMEYFPAHQLHLWSSNAAYVVVFNASLGVEVCQQRLEHWLSMLVSAAPVSASAIGDDEIHQWERPRVFLVATHTDIPAFSQQLVSLRARSCTRDRVQVLQIWTQATGNTSIFSQ